MRDTSAEMELMAVCVRERKFGVLCVRLATAIVKSERNIKKGQASARRRHLRRVVIDVLHAFNKFAVF